jgi:hypothetical protein
MARFVFAVAIVYVLHALTAGAASRANEVENAFHAVPDYPSVEAVLEACHDDMIALCGDAAFRMDTLGACLRENDEILSPGCSMVQDDFRQRSAALREAMLPFRTAATEACAGDVATLCAGISLGRASCLRMNADKISAECSRAQEILRGAQRLARNLHRAD